MKEARALLDRLLHAFGSRPPAPLPEPDAKLALAALMVRVAMSDHNYQLAEISRIDRLLQRLFGLKPIEAAKMRATAEKLSKLATDVEEFAELIRETVRHDARLEALEALWEVVLADGSADAPELEVLEAARAALGLSEADSARARALAESAGDGN